MWRGLLLCGFAFIAAGGTVYGFLQHLYMVAAAAPTFFLFVMLWLGRKWIKPEC